MRFMALSKDWWTVIQKYLNSSISKCVTYIIIEINWNKVDKDKYTMCRSRNIRLSDLYCTSLEFLSKTF